MPAKKVLIIGGGAAGFFNAANLPSSEKYEVTIIEKSQHPLQKVKVSGGGRCNVTHAEFDPKELVKNYPRGEKELRSVFARFQPGDTFEWFESRGLELKTEEDGRVFPITNSSQSVIDVLLKESEKNNVTIQYDEVLKGIEKSNSTFLVTTTKGNYKADFLIMASGSSPSIWNLIERDLKHTIIAPVPSLFTFNCKNELFQDLSGTSFPNSSIDIPELKLVEDGPLLITHWGLSGPTILKLSAYGARELAKLDYKFSVKVNFINQNIDFALENLKNYKSENPSQQIGKQYLFPELTQRFWHRVLFLQQISLNTYWAELSNNQLREIAKMLSSSQIKVNGKSTFKEEFVTAGGVDLKEIDMRTMQSKLHPNLFMAGEMLNIDAITGGFNFQACWSEAYLISDYLKNILS